MPKENYVEILKPCQEKINKLGNPMPKQARFEMNPKQVVPDHCL